MALPPRFYTKFNQGILEMVVKEDILKKPIRWSTDEKSEMPKI